MAAPETTIGGRIAKAALTLGLALCAACGGAQPAAEWADVDPEARPDRPNPVVANPCAAPAIDPALNPCIGADTGAEAPEKPAPASPEAPASSPTEAAAAPDAASPDGAPKPDEAPTP